MSHRQAAGARAGGADRRRPAAGAGARLGRRARRRRPVGPAHGHDAGPAGGDGRRCGAGATCAARPSVSSTWSAASRMLAASALAGLLWDAIRARHDLLRRRRVLRFDAGGLAIAQHAGPTEVGRLAPVRSGDAGPATFRSEGRGAAAGGRNTKPPPCLARLPGFFLRVALPRSRLRFWPVGRVCGMAVRPCAPLSGFVLTGRPF